MTVEVVSQRRKKVVPQLEPSLDGGRDVRLGDGWLGELKDNGNGRITLRWRTDTIALHNFSKTFTDLSQIIFGKTPIDVVRGGGALEAEVYRIGLKEDDSSHFDRKVFTSTFHTDEVTESLEELTAPSESDDNLTIRAHFGLGEPKRKIGFDFTAVMSPPSNISEVTLKMQQGEDAGWSPELIVWLLGNNINRGKFGKIDEIDTAHLLDILHPK